MTSYQNVEILKKRLADIRYKKFSGTLDSFVVFTGNFTNIKSRLNDLQSSWACIAV
ncbi:hypothetical protein BWD162_005090 [Bartonella sp. WD16.2]|nr:hypothetical protein BWD162_005090 [Bartonella sp. WD16.2]